MQIKTCVLPTRFATTLFFTLGIYSRPESFHVVGYADKDMCPFNEIRNILDFLIFTTLLLETIVFHVKLTVDESSLDTGDGLI